MMRKPRHIMARAREQDLRAAAAMLRRGMAGNAAGKAGLRRNSALSGACGWACLQEAGVSAHLRGLFEFSPGG